MWLHVERNGVDTDAQLHGGALVIVPVSEQLEQAALMRRQLIISSTRRPELAKKSDYATGYFR